jgi:hypothetical protein
MGAWAMKNDPYYFRHRHDTLLVLLASAIVVAVIAMGSLFLM